MSSLYSSLEWIGAASRLCFSNARFNSLIFIVVLVSPVGATYSLEPRKSRLGGCEEKAEKCKETDLVYYHCCHGDCCAHFQPLPYIALWIIGASLIMFCCCGCCIRCCGCGKKDKGYRPTLPY
ncbi:unnamed protein product, partial [Mesorhabditis belari]|uniref:Uncharacterized protein n=1 Tax=Mesorhabditis belari TaxID=2138241 RepID=A0AAF3J9N1_9BILA